MTPNWRRAFDQLQEEREITGTISNESRERSVQLFAQLGKKIDRAVRFRKLNGSQAQFYHLNFSSPSQADDGAKKIW